MRYKLGAKLKRGRKRSHQADLQQQRQFKKKLGGIIPVLEGHFRDQRPLRYFCLDESRWGLRTELGRRITLPGVNSVAPVVQWHRAHCSLYGAVEVPTGQSLFYAFSHLDAECFQCFLDRWASHFQDSFNLLQLDQAGAHIPTQLQWPSTSCLCFSRRLVPTGPHRASLAGAQGPVPGTQLRDAARAPAVAVPSTQPSFRTDHPLAHQLEIHPPSGPLRQKVQYYP